ncbi:Uncharacterised protein [Vibrio cholerae]|nr:Uncharacterised protein [Vibrio cholerae]
MWLMLIDPRIHRANNIGRRRISAAPFVLHRTRWVALFRPLIHGVMIGTNPRFIAERPNDHTRVVFIALHHANHALQIGIHPLWIIGKSAHRKLAVGFEIGLIHHIQTVLITQFVPTRMIGVMGGTHRIEIMLFHQFNIAAHACFIHHMPQFGMMFMTVHPADQQGLTIELQ